MDRNAARQEQAMEVRQVPGSGKAETVYEYACQVIDGQEFITVHLDDWLNLWRKAEQFDEAQRRFQD